MRKMWYCEPAKYWEEALPVGNGRMGAMVFGRVTEEVIQLNEDTLWSGTSVDRRNPDCYENLEDIRNLLREGEIHNAEQKALLTMSGIPQSQRAYQTFGKLYIEHKYSGTGLESWKECTEYKRELDLDNAIVRTTWKLKETEYYQEVFASYPASVIVVRLQARGKGWLNLKCHMERGRFFDHAAKCDADSIYLDGNSGGISFACVCKAAHCDGSVSAVGEYLLIEDAKAVTLLLSANTSMRVENPYEQSKRVVDMEALSTYQTLRMEHIKDYSALYCKVKLQFGKKQEEEKLAKIPTNERVARMKGNVADPGLLELYFQYGRYLMISGSRPGSMPLTLQGIWNEDFTPPWESKYTININLQMNYWPAEICGLEECAEPYFTHLRKVMENGKLTAREMYGCRGFVAHHNTDIHGDTAPQDHYIPASYWVMGGAWLATHIYNHYLFTRDISFLKENFEVLREAVLFFRDFLIMDEDGRLVTSPSVSPENTYILEDGRRGCMCDGPTMDNEILNHLFHDYLMAVNELQITDELEADVREMLEKLPPLQIGDRGQLLEWKKDYIEAEPGHRHISHLYGVFPGEQITVEDTPKYANAAKKSLELRLENGGGHTGWSRAWIILLWCRFKDGKRAYENLQELLGTSTFPNLMDSHPMEKYKRGAVFQIDGNMGGITGIAEMLVQSHRGRVELLPALPPQLPAGEVTGLCVRGGAVFDIAWENGKLTRCTIKSKESADIRIRYNGKEKVVSLVKGMKYQLNENLEIVTTVS